VSLVSFKAQNHPQQAASDTVDDRHTPQWLFDELHRAHRFTVDAAASAANAKLGRFWTVEDSGLAHPWAGERVWCNPPYSNLKTWVQYAYRQSRDHGCQLIVMLLPANRTEQGWWQDYIEPDRDKGRGITTRFLRKRLNFGTPTNPGAKYHSSCPFGSVLVTWERP
jgi:phage N-6-adenine-methyltransferase